MTDNIYKQKIVERYQAPLYNKELANPTCEAREVNSLCGDEVKYTCMIRDEMIKEIGWTGQGCAICLAAADLLAEYVDQKPVNFVTTLTDQEIFGLLGIELKPSREKCALLSLNCIMNCLPPKL